MAAPTPTDLFDLSHSLAAEAFSQLSQPWDILSQIPGLILELEHSLPHDFERLAQDVWIGAGTYVESSALIQGPAVIGRNCEIRHNAFLRPNVLIGDNVVIGNSSEVKNSILFDAVQIPHFNYVGDSVLGYHVHLGAGVVLSNVRLDGVNVAVRLGPGEIIQTGLRKFGSLLGDRVEVGCGAVLNPGTVVGRDCLIHPLVNVGGVIPPMNSVRADGSLNVRRT